MLPIFVIKSNQIHRFARVPHHQSSGATNIKRDKNVNILNKSKKENYYLNRNRLCGLCGMLLLRRRERY